MGIGSAEDFIATNLRSDNLADDVSVGKSNDKTIFGRVVFVLGLRNEALASVVVGLACSSALVLGLEAAAEQGQPLLGGTSEPRTYLKYALFLTSLVKGMVILFQPDL
jgi:hypothetical protein